MCPIHYFNDDKRAKERLRLTTVRLKSFLWSERQDGDALKGFGFVSDFSDTGVGLYMPRKFSIDQIVRVAFETEDAAAYRGSVVWSHRFSLEQHFVGHDALSYRLGVKFLFGSEAERKRYVVFLDELKKNAKFLNPGMIF